ncbi:E3 ubiquitin-protein ligase CCNB1IP1 [Zea mays]|uniref:E3 ubiquitin-protein ligase CCNB1IP1 n=1 Tax=Zea mays TaxID=4577 RepID=A0A317YAQ7_MAIZE|nr:E3 ubiquitin-protein ligase CCNB1IP1 [Zea mays]
MMMLLVPQTLMLSNGADDARKILNNDGTCPICDQVLSKSHMKPMDINPGDDWTNDFPVVVFPAPIGYCIRGTWLLLKTAEELQLQHSSVGSGKEFRTKPMPSSSILMKKGD